MKPTTVEEYIANAPAQSKAHSKELRAIIKKTVPKADEKISYGMPYYGYNGRLIYWGAYKDYIGVYVMNDAREALASEIEPYRTSKATLHFPLDQPLPAELISKLVKIQAAANESKH